MCLVLCGHPTCSASWVVYKTQVGRACAQVLTKDQLEFWVLVPCALHPRISRPSKKDRLYLEARSKANNDVETTSWRMCQSRMAKASPPKSICPVQAPPITNIIPRAWNLGVVHSTAERKHKQDFDFKQSWNFKVKIRAWKKPKTQRFDLLSTELFVMTLPVEKPAKKRSEQYTKKVGTKTTHVSATASWRRHHLKITFLPNLRNRDRSDLGGTTTCCKND